METVLNCLGTPAPAVKLCCTESENTPSIDSPQIGNDQLDPKAAGSVSPFGKCSIAAAKSICISSGEWCEGNSSGVHQEDVAEQPSLIPTKVAKPSPSPTLPTVDPPVASASTSTNDQSGESAAETSEAQQARQRTVRVLLGPQVGDLTRRNSDLDDDISRSCCLWPQNCFFRRAEEVGAVDLVENESKGVERLSSGNDSVAESMERSPGLALKRRFEDFEEIEAGKLGEQGLYLTLKMFVLIQFMTITMQLYSLK
jgi:hypothetical protein